MGEHIRKNKLWIAALLILALSLASSNAFAWDGRGGHGRGGDRGHGYEGGWFWGLFATGLVVGAIVATLPPHYDIIYVNGVPYYYYNRVYYRPCPTGYVIVPQPQATAVVPVPAVTQPQAIPGETVVVNIPNVSGGYTPVTLTKYKTGYLGPQGEYYEGHPTVEQLRALYGKE